MILLTPELHAALRANAAAHLDTQHHDRAEPDPVPLVKFFNPLGAATWLATELYSDGDTLFGLADLGFGTPELGTFGLGIERDIGFASHHPLSMWAAWARRAGSILWAETLLRRASRTANDELPPTGG